VVRNGGTSLYPGCVNLSFHCVEGESLEPSYVLRALGAEEDMAHSSIRFGIGRFTSDEEVEYTIERTVKEVNRLRDMSPLWDMVQEGIDIKTIEWTQH